MRRSSWKQVDERAEAIESLYRERYGRFRDGVATITGDQESARDVVQETFARALRKRRTYRGEGSLEAWVWRIALRTARGHVRRLRGRLSTVPSRRRSRSPIATPCSRRRCVRSRRSAG